MKKVLVVDDSNMIISLIKEQIQKYDFIEAYYANTYKEAMRTIRENRGDFHAALLDLNLPDAQNGEVVDLANSHHIPAVILTATINENLKESVLKKDVVDFVLKNDPSSIKFAVTSILRTLKNYDTSILIVDDSSVYRTSIVNMLKRVHINTLESKNGEEALQTLKDNNNITLMITDYEMPKVNGLELTFEVRKTYKKDELSIIAISSLENKELITKFLKYGANDFINKPFSQDELITRINANLELLDLFSTVKDMANKDFLTGLYNRRYFFDSGNQIYSKAKRKKTSIAVAMIDIDNFKIINDTYGHDVGDIAIIEVKKILHKNLRNSDLISRFGGEEFCILLEDISVENIKIVFEKIRKIFEKNVIETNVAEISYTVSTGVCYGLSSSLEEMIKISDTALYEAKESGRNQVLIKS